MSANLEFYMPVIAPPADNSPDPVAYYAGLGTDVNAVPFGTNGAMQITVTKPVNPPPPGQAPLSTVYATAAGFATFYPSAASVTTADGVEIITPPDLVGPDFGAVVLKIWIADFSDLSKSEESSPPARATHQVHIGLLRSAVEDAFKDEINKMSQKVLLKSWESTGGPSPQALKDAFRQRALKGEAEIFVSAGTVLGAMSLQPGAPVDTWRLILQTLAVSKDPSPVSVAPDGLIYDVARAPTFVDHPLPKNLDKIGNITFNCTFDVWNNANLQYEHLSPTTAAGVALRQEQGKDPDPDKDQLLSSAPFNGTGLATLVVPVSRRAKIYFIVRVSGKEIGNRTFSTDLLTESERVYDHLTGATYQKTYKLKYKILPGYKKFVQSLSKDEPYDLDRQELTDGFTKGREKRHWDLIEKLENLDDPSKLANQFNVLFEGDSWTDYPVPPHEDLFLALDALISANLLGGRTYNKIPLQHYGDRSDQMFAKPDDLPKPADSRRQWDFTKDFIDEYKIDLIVLSAGGCDFAEPGISDLGLIPKHRGPFGTNLFTDGYFDPNQPSWNDLLETDRTVATRLMGSSFAALLKNHRWNLFLNHDTGGQVDAKSYNATLLAALHKIETEEKKDFGDSAVDTRAVSAAKVIAGFPKQGNGLGFPFTATGVYNSLLDKIFHAGLMAARYESVYQNLKIIVDYADKKEIPIICHSYGYPLFSKKGTPVAAVVIVAGPWLNVRLEQAGITDQRIQVIAIKTLIDNFVRIVLETLKNGDTSDPSKKAYPIFDYVDLRPFGPEQEANSAGSFWKDEMHLTKKGYEAVGEKMFDLIKSKFDGFFTA